MLVNQVAKKKHGRPRKNIDLGIVLTLIQAGKKDQEIADELAVSVRTLRTFRKEHGIPPAKGHGGSRPGAGRKKTTGCPDDLFMARQQAIDARVNSIDAGLRVNKDYLHGGHWLRWAGSAFKFSQSRSCYVSKIAGFGIPVIVQHRKQ